MRRSMMVLLGFALAAGGCGAGAHGSTSLSGCLNDGGDRAPSRGAPGRAAPEGDAVAWLTASGGEIRVERSFEHACCLSGDVETERGSGSFDVRVQLSGEPCRCLCSSTVSASSGPIGPGAYRVRLFVGDRLEAEGEVLVP